MDFDPKAGEIKRLCDLCFANSRNDPAAIVAVLLEAMQFSHRQRESGNLNRRLNVIRLFLFRVQVDYSFDRSSANRAKTDLVAAEHNAIDLWPVIALSLVVGALKRADFTPILFSVKHRRLVLFFFGE